MFKICILLCVAFPRFSIWKKAPLFRFLSLALAPRPLWYYTLSTKHENKHCCCATATTIMSNNTTTNTTQFDSEGFDLSAVVAAEEGDEDDHDDVKGGGGGGGRRAEVVYEIGGGVTVLNECKQKKIKEENNNNTSSPIDESERLKELGNQDFKLGNHLDAYDYYTDAILACPYGDGFGPSGQELLKLRQEFDEQNRERMMEKQRLEMNKRREKRNHDNNNNNNNNMHNSSSSSTATDGKDDNDDDDDEKVKDRLNDPFVPPRHIYGPKLAVYYANRAATLLHLGRNGEVVEDCDIALLYNPTYAKAYLRRCTAQERVENTEDALRDAQKALQLEPSNSATRKTVLRLEAIEKERMEKLKEETMGKLKDLGNSLLSNFGLSLDNFNTVQDPKTGGYSISFNQNGKK